MQILSLHGAGTLLRREWAEQVLRTPSAEPEFVVNKASTIVRLTYQITRVFHGDEIITPRPLICSS